MRRSRTPPHSNASRGQIKSSKPRDKANCYLPGANCFSVPVSAAAASSAVTTAASATTPAITTTTTTAATSAAAIAASATTAVASTAGAFRLGPGLVDVNVAIAKRGPIGSGNRLCGLLIVGHFHKGKTARLAGIAIAHNGHIIYLSISFESCPEIIFTDVVIEIAYINILHSFLFLFLGKQLPQLLTGRLAGQ